MSTTQAFACPFFNIPDIPMVPLRHVSQDGGHSWLGREQHSWSMNTGRGARGQGGVCPVVHHRWLFLLGISMVIILTLGLPALARESDEVCKKLGFSPTLLCSSCSTLSEFVLPPGSRDSDEQRSGEDLVKECRQCCLEETDGEDQGQYPYATLAVDEQLLPL